MENLLVSRYVCHESLTQDRFEGLQRSVPNLARDVSETKIQTRIACEGD